MDFSWSEMLLVGVVALIVIGPKDLPGMFRELGRITAKIRAMGREFSRAMDQAARETGVKDVTDGLKAVSNPKAAGLDAVKSAADKFEKWDPLKNAAKPTTPPPVRTAKDIVAAGAAAAAATAAVDPAKPAPAALGPATAALAEKQAARKAVAAEAAEKLRKVAAAPATPAVAATAAAEQPAKSPGRTRKKAAKTAGDAA
jgi:sec-independent protein translocase protein TatB